jgi:hypothetical protein
MNYQITQEMPEYFPDLDQMLFHLPLIGHTFKKVWWNPNFDRQCSDFVKAEDFVVAPESKDLYTSPDIPTSFVCQRMTSIATSKTATTSRQNMAGAMA